MPYMPEQGAEPYKYMPSRETCKLRGTGRDCSGAIMLCKPKGATLGLSLDCICKRPVYLLKAEDVPCKALVLLSHATILSSCVTHTCEKMRKPRTAIWLLTGHRCIQETETPDHFAPPSQTSELCLQSSPSCVGGSFRHSRSWRKAKENGTAGKGKVLTIVDVVGCVLRFGMG